MKEFYSLEKFPAIEGLANFEEGLPVLEEISRDNDLLSRMEVAGSLVRFKDFKNFREALSVLEKIKQFSALLVTPPRKEEALKIIEKRLRRTK